MTSIGAPESTCGGLLALAEDTRGCGVRELFALVGASLSGGRDRSPHPARSSAEAPCSHLLRLNRREGSEDIGL
ncbi:MAG: hypothetical protein U0271_19450 [Polyangiaceae bacterium]